MTMKIPYCTRSKFIKPCAVVIAADKSSLLGGKPVTVNFSKIEHPSSGYTANNLVVIDRSDLREFEADWLGDDPTRFSVRARAAATALREDGSFGRFRIKHQNGVLTITKM